MDKKQLLNENHLALAGAITLSLLYIVITILMVAIPDSIIWALSHLLHIKAAAPTIVELTGTGFLVGLLEVFIGSYFILLVFGWIYNMFVYTEINKKP